MALAGCNFLKIFNYFLGKSLHFGGGGGWPGVLNTKFLLSLSGELVIVILPSHLPSEHTGQQTGQLRAVVRDQMDIDQDHHVAQRVVVGRLHQTMDAPEEVDQRPFHLVVHLEGCLIPVKLLIDQKH